MTPQHAPQSCPTPARKKLYWKKLTSTELTVLMAMIEIGGEHYLYPSIACIASYTKLSPRAVQITLHGCKAGTKQSARVGLIARHAIRAIAPANAARRRPTTYVLQLEALPLDRELFEAALQNGWEIPKWLIAELSDEDRQRIQEADRYL